VWGRARGDRPTMGTLVVVIELVAPPVARRLAAARTHGTVGLLYHRPAMSVFLGVDPGEWIGSNGLAFAIRDAFPVSRGHSLVIPRRVVATWWDTTSDEQHAIIDLLDAIKRRVHT
jgi:HIT domain